MGDINRCMGLVHRAISAMLYGCSTAKQVVIPVVETAYEKWEGSDGHLPGWGEEL